MPFKKPITVVVGEPIHVDKDLTPSAEVTRPLSSPALWVDVLTAVGVVMCASPSWWRPCTRDT
jgi:hypothetical protein